MDTRFIDRVPAWLAPLVGGVAPAVFLSARLIVAGTDLVNALSPVTVWIVRDTLLGFCFALPFLVVAAHVGIKHPLAHWFIAMVVGLPMGFVLANPVQFAYTPTEADFEYSPYWLVMFGYAALFGLTGVAYAVARFRGAPAHAV